MAVTEDRLRTDEKLFRELEDEWPQAALEDAVREEPESRAESSAIRLGENREHQAVRRWSRRLMAAWALVLTPLFVLAPAPDNPEAALSGLSLAVTVAFMAAFFVMLAGLGQGARWGFGASAAAALIGVGSGIACAATGHHEGGWWPAYEAAAFGGLVAFTWVASRRAARSEAPAG